MWLLLLEAFLAMMVLVFIVWWTMFSGRKPDAQTDPHRTSADDDTGRGKD
jgi:hypothetical protein